MYERTSDSSFSKTVFFHSISRLLEEGIRNIFKTYRFWSVLLVLVCFFSLDALATTWYVPDDYPTIQGAIDATSVVNGDTVIVREGTYYENISFNGKAITLRSEKGAATTIIDGGQAGRVVGFGDDEDAGTVLKGFTIQNGYASIGGGIFCQNCAAPEFTNCMITGNRADGEGGGVNCYYYCFPIFVNCTISGNSAGSAGYGGGVCAKNSSAVNISNSVLWGDEAGGVANEIYYSGGGVYVSYSAVEGGWNGTGNIAIDPKLVDQRPASEAPTAAGDYHLTQDSPCIDKGTTTGAPEYDFEGDPRLASVGGDDMPDMGADEYTSAPQAPAPDIKANGSDGPVYIEVGDNLSLMVELDAGDFLGHDADWWVVDDTPFGWYRYDVVNDLWKPGFAATYQGPLNNVAPFQVWNQTLPVGTYTIYFGVDMNMNGVLDIGQAYYDSVDVIVTP